MARHPVILSAALLGIAMPVFAGDHPLAEARLALKQSASGGKGQFDYIYAVATGADGSVYVADRLNRRVPRFDSGGKFLTRWGREGTGAGEFGFTEWGGEGVGDGEFDEPYDV